MATATVSRGARRFVLAGVLFLVAWQATSVAGAPRPVGVALGLLGFVFHTVFGKAYTLVSCFDHELAVPGAPSVQFPLTVAGVLALAVAGTGYGDDLGVDPGLAASVGAALWAAGVAVFLAALGWTARDTLSDAETGTSEASNRRLPLNSAVNAAVSVALGYLAVGSYGLLGVYTVLPWAGAYATRVFHLLATGTAALLVFAAGFRLLPRFVEGSPPRTLATVVLVAGAAGPALIATGLAGGPVLVAGAFVEAVAVVGFALTYAVLFARSDHRQVGFYGVAAGAGAGVLGVLLGLQFAFAGRTVALTEAHFRLNALGLLGLAIVGVSYQFYPPGVASLPAVGDRAALAAIVALTAGLVCEAAGLTLGVPPLTTAGHVFALAGALIHACLLFALFCERY